MKKNKKNFRNKLMSDFEKFGGGKSIEKDDGEQALALAKELQDSFDKIFPELVKPPKHRKHVIFDHDVFQFFETLCGDNGSKFSSMINSALRSFVRERLGSVVGDNDPIAELLKVKQREQELLDEIKTLNLTEELKKKLG